MKSEIRSSKSETNRGNRTGGNRENREETRMKISKCEILRADPGGITERSRGVEVCRDPRIRVVFFPHPEGCARNRLVKLGAHLFRMTRVGLRMALASLQDAEISSITFPGVSADLNHPATLWQLFELRRDFADYVFPIHRDYSLATLRVAQGFPESRFPDSSGLLSGHSSSCAECQY